MGGTPLLEGTLSETYAAWRIAQDALDAVGGDDTVARIEAEQRVKQMEIEDVWHAVSKLKIGTLAAEFGLQHYRANLPEFDADKCVQCIQNDQPREL